MDKNLFFLIPFIFLLILSPVHAVSKSLLYDFHLSGACYPEYKGEKVLTPPGVRLADIGISSVETWNITDIWTNIYTNGQKCYNTQFNISNSSGELGFTEDYDFTGLDELQTNITIPGGVLISGDPYIDLYATTYSSGMSCWTWYYVPTGEICAFQVYGYNLTGEITITTTIPATTSTISAGTDLRDTPECLAYYNASENASSWGTRRGSQLSSFICMVKEPSLSFLLPVLMGIAVVILVLILGAIFVKLSQHL